MATVGSTGARVGNIETNGNPYLPSVGMLGFSRVWSVLFDPAWSQIEEGRAALEAPNINADCPRCGKSQNGCVYGWCF